MITDAASTAAMISAVMRSARGGVRNERIPIPNRHQIAEETFTATANTRQMVASYVAPPQAVILS
jgi:hypothetical protein